jgi:hypothetical protein
MSLRRVISLGRPLCRIFLSALGLMVVGCSSQPCKGRESISDAAKLKWNDEAAAQKKSLERVLIFKADGSLKCSMGQSIPPEAMAKELDGVQMFKMESRIDGMMRPEVCGYPTGKINVYEIRAIDLERAKKLKFKVMTET